MFFLSVIFFVIPLYFSHVFFPLGRIIGEVSFHVFSSVDFIIGEVSSFERQKIYIFLLLLCIASIECILRYPYSLWNNLRRYYLIISVLIIFPICSGLYFNGSLDSRFFLGSYEKHHGYFFYIGILIFTLLILSSPREALKKYLTWSIYSAILVAIIAIGEHIGGIWDIYGRTQMISAYSGRSSSTLGNPNYVAGFLLPFVPIFIFYIQKNTKKLVWSLIGLVFIVVGVFVTGSYIAIFITCSIFLWYGISWIFRKYSTMKRLMVFSLLVLCILFSGFFLLDSEKLLSFQSRFVLMQESIHMMIQSPESLLIGFGPESLLTHFSGERTLLVNQYFPKSMLIDSSHNVIIDGLVQYGLFLLILIISMFYSQRNKLDHPIALSILSLIFFLSLNVYVLSHIIFLVLSIAIFVRDPDILFDIRGENKS